MRPEQIINFIQVIESFKTCERTCRTTGKNRFESDAEHSWHLALFLMLIESDFKNVDSLKLLKLALIHDLPEIYAGDTNPYRDDTKNKEENEANAAKKLFSNLATEDNLHFNSLFQEYIDQNTTESKIVKSADKLMPLIQNLCTNESHSSYREKQVTYQEAKNYMDEYFTSDDILKDFYEILISRADTAGVFFDKKADT
ncbi:HD domain-containing protein [Desulfogranum mediterraneum]|uniref:HD domain-containing protein n=1 Tax=Desulfogranum mediterraneum TaxID=160661 RepID=UPI00068803AE|nr:HD domain-containing protein [Desulfogranum mediterraneum]